MIIWFSTHNHHFAQYIKTLFPIYEIWSRKKCSHLHRMCVNSWFPDVSSVKDWGVKCSQLETGGVNASRRKPSHAKLMEINVKWTTGERVNAFSEQNVRINICARAILWSNRKVSRTSRWLAFTNSPPYLHKILVYRHKFSTCMDNSPTWFHNSATCKNNSRTCKN